MNIFEQASKVGLRFSTELGTLTVEDLWQLPLTTVDEMAVQCRSIVESDTESFITKKLKVSSTTKLQFEILKSVIETRMDDAEKAEKKLANKQRIQHLLELRNKKELDKDAELSIEDLDAMIAEISE